MPFILLISITSKRIEKQFKGEFLANKNQKKWIRRKNWDCLIILDACRYDYFEKIYKDFFNGKLTKLISPGCPTPEWLSEVFGDKYYEDIVYVSGNPHVNSKGINLYGDFNARKHFKVIDVWESSWNDKYKTVPPKYVSKSTRLARAKYPEKRIISHFMQPHWPYISIGPLGNGINFLRNRGKKKNKEESKSFFSKIGGILQKIMGWKNMHKIKNLLKSKEKIRSLLNLRLESELEKVVAIYGKEGLKSLYEENLKIALQEVTKMINRLPGRVIITSDHGELLGEEGLYGHPSGFAHNKLLEVPWLEIK